MTPPYIVDNRSTIEVNRIMKFSCKILQQKLTYSPMKLKLWDMRCSSLDAYVYMSTSVSERT